jgi:hypothetical protein|tara:strand:- start:835 stop:1974 length:1140 start_codon:yes stop_codon:yes gene_type:complete
MSLTALKGKKTKKKVLRARARTGLAGIPVDKGFNAVKDYFHLQVDRKDCVSQVKTWVKKNFPQPSKYILANPEYHFSMTHHAATAFWYNNDLYKNNDADGNTAKEFLNNLFDKMIPLIEKGKVIYEEKQKANNIVSISPAVKLMRKINNTIMQELLDLEDKWIDGDDATINIYDRFKYHGLTNTAISHVKPMIEGWLLDYEDAYYKRCDQAVEGYSHLKRSTLNHRIKVCKAMLEDLERIRSATKATRNVKVKRPKSVDKQVARVQYKKEDNDFKIVSINPIQIPTKSRLYAFNTKSKMVIEYITESVNGFEISGSTIKNFSKGLSRTICLRKPLDFLPIVLQKTPKQIDAAWQTLKTKTKVPNGRINKDTILLRVLDK